MTTGISTRNGNLDVTIGSTPFTMKRVALYLNRLLWKTERTGTAEGDAKGDETGKKGDEKAERWQ